MHRAFCAAGAKPTARTATLHTRTALTGHRPGHVRADTVGAAADHAGLMILQQKGMRRACVRVSDLCV